MRRKRSTFQYRMSAWKSHAKERNLNFEITEEHIKKLPLICAYSGIPLTMEVGKDNTVSLDRIDSKLGYVPGNVVFCTKWINLMKKDKPLKEFIDMCNIIVLHWNNKNPS